MLELTPLHPGTIKDLFSEKRNTPRDLPRERRHPLALPTVETQCVHVESYGEEDYDHVRCVSDADFTGRHGWLCLKHQPSVWRPRGFVPQDKNTAVVTGILATERRAFRDGRRVTLQIGARVRIAFLL